jgi:hypothetical protein
MRKQQIPFGMTIKKQRWQEQRQRQIFRLRRRMTTKKAKDDN